MESLQRNPDWTPLERALDAEFGSDARRATSAFRFVGVVQGPADVGSLRVYQNSVTRVHVTLDGDGRAYRYFAEMDRYGGTSVGQALQAAMSGHFLPPNILEPRG
ncbi:MAG: hypothetical protein ACO1Q7_20160 [Gemmatimonas sp.]